MKYSNTVSILAEYLIQMYFSTPSTGIDGSTPSLLNRLTAIATSLASEKDVGSAALTGFKVSLLL